MLEQSAYLKLLAIHTPDKVRKTTIDKMGWKDRQNPQKGKIKGDPDNISTNDLGESTPRREATSK